jgi:hypothetical protein
VNVRLVISGREVQWTLRDTEETRLAERLSALLARYPVPEPPPLSPQQHNAKAIQRPITEPTPEGYCVLHGLEMKLQVNQRGSWWSHRLADGSYCKGR